MRNHKLFIGLLAVGLAATATQAVEPVLSYKVTGNELILTYSGTLLQSTDAVNWTEVGSASSPYVVTLGDKKLFFCAKGEDTHDKDITIPLSDDVSLDMIWIEPGTFMMGSPKSEQGRDDEETQHQVTLTQSYWLGQYEVTQAQYQTIMGTNPSKWKGADLPVEQVSWENAMAFCAQLTEREKAAGRLPEGYEYTLPTEAQWEYACRAGTTTALNSGKNLSSVLQCPEMDEVGWYWYNGGKENDANGLTCTHPVGQKQPNAWGLYDMHGNVFEWCLDRYGAYPASSVTDPTGASIGTYRVTRSGCWGSNAFQCRSAYRSRETPDRDWYYLGFRVALTPTKNKTIPLSDDVSLDMIWIEPGVFIMGSSERELGREDDEPKHQVTLTKGYWLGQYEVTQAQYETVMGMNPSYFKGSDLPVETVSWNDAMEFCAKLTARERATGRLPKDYEYTLPTEAQWEYACRAETTTALNSGKNLSDEYECPEMDEVGWYWYNGGLENDANGLTCTHPVGQKQPNAWGLHDMHGNVWEWCLDWYGSYPTSSVTDPAGPSTGSSRMLRGGSWYDSADACRSAFRNCYYPSDYDYYIGFRVALVENKDMTIPLSGTVNLDMIWIEPGTFIMGSPDDELGKWSGEVQHEVTLTSGYWLGKYEVTQAQYEAVMGTNPSEFKGADLPVEQISWKDATNFCAKLTAIERAAGRLPEGYEYTLPTEAQWEYACRAGTTTALNSGKNLSSALQCPEVDEVAWYKYNSDKMTHPVGQKQPNAWGLYDMHGNVYEWCLDWYGDYPASSVTDPTGAGTGPGRVVRSGGWHNTADYCRSAFRYYYSPSINGNRHGFRVALAPAPENKDMTIPLSGTVNLDMIWIEPGTFIMGSPEDEQDKWSGEVQHEVTLTSGYWLGKYEVTQAQYEAVMGTNPSEFKGADLPVEQVSWNDAMEFCAKLTAIERAAGRLPKDYEYTLPTEAQWEYACRAGTTTALNSGKNLSSWVECPEMDEVGWYWFNCDNMPHPVGQKLPNAWSLYDMHGNVREWCLDRYGDYPTSSVTDPKGARTGLNRVNRGGGWYDYADFCRSASRNSYDPNDNISSYGFRVALSIVQ